MHPLVIYKAPIDLNGEILVRAEGFHHRLASRLQE